MLRSLRFPFHWFVLLVGLAASGCGDEPAETRLVGEGPASLVALAVEAEAPAEDDSLGAVRSTFQVDGGAATWYDALAAPGRDPAMGLVASGRTVLHGWRWWSDADSTVLGPEERIRGVARPDVAVRSYMERDTSGLVEKVMAQIQGDRPSRLSERVTLLDTERDGQAALLIDVADSVGTVGFWPVRSDQREAGQYRVEEVGGVLVFAAAADVPTDTTVTPAGPIWTAIASGEVRSTSVEETAPEGGRDQAFALGEVVVETPGALAVATGATPEAAAGAARAALRDRASRREARSDRLAARLDEVAFQTRDETTNTAFQWAVLTLDALTVRDSARVAMLPGLPGAEPESFPSASLVTGALLDLGQWETTRDMLTATGAVQRFDRRLDLLGRAPDLVRLDGDDVFATADATPLFLAAAGDYVRTTGDRGLVTGAEDFWFKTVFALRGIYEPDGRNGSAMDTLGHVLASGRRGTWLDGDPSRGGIERRGAIAEGQGALYRALRTATAFAEIMGVSQRSSASWYADTAGVLVRQFQDEFVRDGLVVDQLRGDARRPGGLLALALLDGLPPAERGQLARALAERLAYPYGVASLVQSDSTFHPFLEAPGLYTPESARANGAVHTWLTGPLAVLMAETGGAEFAATLVDVQARLLLDAGAVGAIPELVAGHPRAEGEAPDVGGAPVTPWSLAGFVEGAISGLVGASYPDADTLVLAPRLPEAWGETSLRMRLGDGAVRLVIASGADGAEVRAEPEGDLSAAATLVVDAGGRRVAVPLAEAQSDTLVTPREAFTVAVDATSATVDGEEVPSGPAAGPAGVWDGFAFAAPRLQEEYAVMRAVENQRSLSDDQILRDNPRANLSSTQTDPQGDDWGGTSTFVYPEGTEPGVLDATYLEVARDDSTTYLRAEFVDLSEDTVVAFALDTEPGGAPTVGRGANYEFPDGRGYEYVVFAGAGLAVEDASGRVVGQLSSGSVFDTQTASLAFALPSFIVPRLERGDRVTMLVGARGPDGGFLRVA
ncbi:MAG: amylo-alpha-1,6-glucosidase, partial [Bacteroidota bacterium]